MCDENKHSICCHVLVGAVVAAFGIVNSSALGQCEANEWAVLTDSKRPDAGAFGVSIAIDGGTAVIGDVSDIDNGVNAGAAYVFQFDGSNWVQQQKLLAADGAAGDVFGGTVTISGDTIVIGARNDDDNGNYSGSAYVFRFDPDTSSWIQDQKLLPDDGHFSDYFGISVAVSGDIALIGAHFSSIIPGSTAGAAYVFRHDGSNWVQEQKLLPDDQDVASRFGISVALDGDIAVIGAYLDDDLGSFSGSAYVFRFDGLSWVFEHKLLAADGGSGDSFGFPVAISGETVVVGARRHDEFGPQSGAAYVYRFDGSTWHQEQELLPGDGAPFDNFGWAVAVAGDTAVIGAWFDDNENGIDAGSVYAYRFDGNAWTEQAKLTAADTLDSYQLGWSAALSGDVAMFGEGHHTYGSVSVFRGLSDCNDTGTLDICDIAEGTSKDANANGIPDECECPADLDDNGSVGILDLLTLLAAWGSDPAGPPDFDGDGNVGILDLLTLLANWGPCA
ncbi:MAG: PKD domain-containing protein [Planctomycetes bacterium]|nr:PKD domain-containing protein [Planctomycetota bacterium]